MTYINSAVSFFNSSVAVCGHLYSKITRTLTSYAQGALNSRIYHLAEQTFQSARIKCRPIITKIILITCDKATTAYYRVAARFFSDKTAIRKEALRRINEKIKGKNSFYETELFVNYDLIDMKEMEVAKIFLKQHRSFFQTRAPAEINFGVPKLQKNDVLFTCDKGFTTAYHRVAARFLSDTNINTHKTVIRKTALKYINEKIKHKNALSKTELFVILESFCTDVFCNFFVGYKNTDPNGLFFSPEYLKYADLNDQSKIIGYMLHHKEIPFTENQIQGFIISLLLPLKTLVPGITEEVIWRYGKETQLQQIAYESLNQEATDQEQLNTEILKVIVEQLRLSSFSPNIGRGEPGGRDFSIRPRDYALRKEVVGPHPRRFNSERFSPIAAWPMLPWMPFGAGPHICPGWRFFKYLSALFVETLLKEYQITLPSLFLKLQGFRICLTPRKNSSLEADKGI